MTGTLITRRTLLSLDYMGEFFSTVVQVPFKIQGLCAWNVHEADQVSSMQVGHTMAQAAGGYVPASFYAMPPDWGYARLAAALEAGELVPQSWGPDYFLAPGTMFKIRVSRSMAGLALGPIQFAIFGAQVEAYSQETLNDLPNDYYFDLLVIERQALRLRMNQIDQTLENVSRPGKLWIVPKDEPPDSDPQRMTVPKLIPGSPDDDAKEE